MTADLAVYRSLRTCGASAIEAAAVLSVMAEVDAIELAADAWRHELRGRGGQWTRTAGGALRLRTTGSANTRSRRAHMAAISQSRRAADEAASKAKEEAAADAARKIADSTAKLEQMQAADEKKTARIKLALHIGIIAAGAALGYIEAKIGLPGGALAQVGTGIAPSVVQELTDWKKGLG